MIVLCAVYEAVKPETIQKIDCKTSWNYIASV
jgi:hypothetical protein